MGGPERHHVLDELLAESVERLKERKEPTVRPTSSWKPLEEEDPYVPEVRAPALRREGAAEEGAAAAGRTVAEQSAEELRARLSRQRRRNLRLARELERVREQLAAQEAERGELQKRIADLEAEVGELDRRARELTARLEEERLRRTRAELELERLQGRVAVLKPLLEGLARAGEELGIAAAPPQRPAPEPAEPGAQKGGLMRAIAGAVEQWRGPGPRPVH